MRAAISTLLTKTVDDGIIQSNPAHLAKYANVADSIAHMESQNGALLHQFIDYLMWQYWLWAEYCTIISVFFRGNNEADDPKAIRIEDAGAL